MRIMIVMGIDPGLGVAGWAVVVGEGEACSLLASGAIRTKPSDDMADRLLAICNTVRDLVGTHHPDEVAIEDVFLAKDARAAFALGQARGAAMVGAALQGLPVHSYTALQVKKSVTGNGHASKEQVSYMVIRLLDLKEPLHPADSSDAAAIALCHLARCKDVMQVVGGGA
jgi:crossover junction endodeoxyribonuclease RuvC